MNRGYIKLWRKSFDAGWIKNYKLWAFWTWCLLKASHREVDLIVGSQTVHLMPGEFVFGRKAASMETGISEQSIRTIIDSLRKSKNLTIKSTNKFSIVSVVNWDIYQGNGKEINQQTNQPLTNKEPATNHKQECKEHNNEKNINIYSPTSDEVRLSDRLFQKILFRNPGFKKPNIQKWSLHIDRLVRLDGKTFLEIEKVIDWSQEDLFWQYNILCTEKLRKQYDALNTKRLAGGKNGQGNIGSNGQVVKKGRTDQTGRAKSDGEPYPIDYEFS